MTLFFFLLLYVKCLCCSIHVDRVHLYPICPQKWFSCSFFTHKNSFLPQNEWELATAFFINLNFFSYWKGRLLVFADLYLRRVEWHGIHRSFMLGFLERNRDINNWFFSNHEGILDIKMTWDIMLFYNSNFNELIFCLFLCDVRRKAISART